MAKQKCCHWTGRDFDEYIVQREKVVTKDRRISDNRDIRRMAEVFPLSREEIRAKLKARGWGRRESLNGTSVFWCPPSRLPHLSENPPRKYPELWDWYWLNQRYTIEGRSTVEIAKGLGCGKSTVRTALIRMHIKIRHNHPTKKTMLLRDRDWLEEQIFTKFKSGPEIAKELGCTSVTVNRWASAHGLNIPRRTPFYKLEDKAWLEEKYHGEQLSYADIGELLGCKEATVGKYIHLHGIQPRPSGRRPIFFYCPSLEIGAEI